MPKRRIVQTLVLVALAVLASAALARDPLPGFQELERELDNIAESTALSDTEKKRLSDSVRSAIDNIRRANEFDERARSYAKAVESLPEERNKAAELLRNFKPRIVDDRLRNASPETLEARQIEVTTQMATIRRDLQQLRETLQTERSAPLQTLIDDARQAAATATTSSDLGAPTDPEAQGPFQNITTVAIAARKKWQQARLNALEQQLISRPARLALMETEEQYLAQHLADAETHLESVQAILSSQRSASADELARRFRAISESIQEAPPEVRQAAKENASLATQLVNLLAKRRQTQSDLASFRDSLALLDAKFGSLNRLLKLDQFESTALFGAALRRERDTASQALNVESTREFTERELTASRVALFELDERLPPYQFTDEQLRTLHATEIEGLWRDSARSVLSGRQDLVADIGTHLRQYVDELSSLLEQIKSLTARSANYRELLESHLFWIPSAQVIGPASFFAATDTMEWLLAPSHWQQVAQAVRKNLVKNALVYVLGLLLLCFAVLARMRLKQRLTDMEPAIGRVRSDRFALTLEAVGITALLAVPFPMLMFLAAVFTDATAGFSRGVSTAFLTTGQTMLFLEFVLQLVRSKGLAELHFRWKPTTLALIRRLNRWLMVVLLPTVFVMVLLDLQATPDIRDGLGRLALVLLCITIAAVAYQLMKASTIRTQTVPESPRFKERLGYPTLIAAMGVLIALSLLGVLLQRYAIAGACCWVNVHHHDRTLCLLLRGARLKCLRATTGL